MFMVMSAVFSPIRAAAIAASHPACPAPTTTTSYCSANAIWIGKKPYESILRFLTLLLYQSSCHPERSVLQRSRRTCIEKSRMGTWCCFSLFPKHKSVILSEAYFSGAEGPALAFRSALAFRNRTRHCSLRLIPRRVHPCTKAPTLRTLSPAAA